MDLTLSDKEKGFFKQIWKILGKESISKGDLIYEICYKLNLPFRPSLLSKKIKEAEENGILIKIDDKYTLNNEDKEEIEKEKLVFSQNHGKIFPSQVIWDRIEDSSDPWIMKPISNSYNCFSSGCQRRRVVSSEQYSWTTLFLGFRNSRIHSCVCSPSSSHNCNKRSTWNG